MRNSDLKDMKVLSEPMNPDSGTHKNDLVKYTVRLMCWNYGRERHVNLTLCSWPWLCMANLIIGCVNRKCFLPSFYLLFLI